MTSHAVGFLILLELAVSLPAFSQQGRNAGVPPDSVFAEIRGRISLPRKGETRQALAHGGMSGMYSMHAGGNALPLGPSGGGPTKLSEKAAVYLESDELDQAPYPISEKTPSLNQSNLQFHPQVLPIMVGTRVEFPNRDNLFHNVFSYSQAKDFDLGRYPKDDSRSVTFDKPGVVRVYCDIHSHMQATILVLKHPYFASPDDAGDFVIARVPPGKYRIVLWYERDPVDRKTVQVKGGEILQVDFAGQGSP
jgi:plastocyanin